MQWMPLGDSGLQADDWAVDDETARREDRSLSRPVETDDGALVGQVLYVAEVSLQRSLRDGHLPLGQVHVPEWAEAALTRIPAQHIQRREAVENRGVQTLAIGLVASV